MRRGECLRHQYTLVLRACPTKIACSRVAVSATSCQSNDIQDFRNFLISLVVTSVQTCQFVVHIGNGHERLYSRKEDSKQPGRCRYAPASYTRGETIATNDICRHTF